jgi:hypothetical protein
MAGFGDGTPSHYTEPFGATSTSRSRRRSRRRDRDPADRATPRTGGLLVQPQLAAEGSATICSAAPTTRRRARLDAVLRASAGCCVHRAARDGRSVTVDAQLSNWHFGAAGNAGGDPLLIDIGTPFMRKDGADEIGIELFLAPMPPGLRALYRRARAVERYLDAFFDARSLLVDAVANFHKEGRPDRIELGL